MINFEESCSILLVTSDSDNSSYPELSYYCILNTKTKTGIFWWLNSLSCNWLQGYLTVKQCLVGEKKFKSVRFCSFRILNIQNIDKHNLRSRSLKNSSKVL